MFDSPFDYQGNVFGTVCNNKGSLGCNVNSLGMGARSFYPYLFGSSMNLPIEGIVAKKTCPADTTGSKRFRPAYWQPGIQVVSTCSTLDPTDACSYRSSDMQRCSFGFERDPNDYQSPTDSNRFAQYKWGG